MPPLERHTRCHVLTRAARSWPRLTDRGWQVTTGKDPYALVAALLRTRGTHDRIVLVVDEIDPVSDIQGMEEALTRYAPHVEIARNGTSGIRFADQPAATSTGTTSQPVLRLRGATGPASADPSAGPSVRLTREEIDMLLAEDRGS